MTDQPEDQKPKVTQELTEEEQKPQQPPQESIDGQQLQSSSSSPEPKQSSELDSKQKMQSLHQKQSTMLLDHEKPPQTAQAINQSLEQSEQARTASQLSTHGNEPADKKPDPSASKTGPQPTNMNRQKSRHDGRKQDVNYDRTLMPPQELDFFALETKARKTISQLIKPLLNDRDVDRKKMVDIVFKQDRIAERLKKIEYSVGLCNEKPQIFVDIENEIADMKQGMVLNKTDLQYGIDLANQRMMSIERDLLSFKQQNQSLEAQIHMREQTLKDIQQKTYELQKRLNDEVAKLDKVQSNFDFRLNNQNSTLNTNLQGMNQKIASFEVLIGEMQKFVKTTFDLAQRDHAQIGTLQDMKVETKEFASKMDDLLEQIETIRYATYDNFRVIRATDNYIEKYLPFKTQAMISASILSFVKKPYGASDLRQGKGLVLTEKEKRKLKVYENFKDQEYKSFKEFHRMILQDDGNPSLRKTVFRMPGYRQILADDQLAEYEIKYEERGAPKLEQDIVAVDSEMPEEDFGAASQFNIPMRLSEKQHRVSFGTKNQSEHKPSIKLPQSAIQQINEEEQSDDEICLDVNRAQYLQKAANDQVINVQKMMSQARSPKQDPYLTQALALSQSTSEQNSQRNKTVISSNELSQNDQSDQQDLIPLKSPLQKTVSHGPKGPALRKQPTMDKNQSSPPKRAKFAQDIGVDSSDNLKPAPLAKAVSHMPAKSQASKIATFSQQSRRDMMSNEGDAESALNMFHTRRKQTHFMCGWDDLEDEVVRIIKKNDQAVERAHERIQELTKELEDFKKYQERLNNNTENPFLDSIKGLLDEQVTMIFTIQGEIKQDMNKIKDQQKDQIFQMSDMEDKVQQLRAGLGIQFEQTQVPHKQENVANTFIDKRKHLMKKRTKDKNPLQAEKTPIPPSRASSQLMDGGSQFAVLTQDMTLQSGELLVDLMKLQNILNFELLKGYMDRSVPPLYTNTKINQLVNKETGSPVKGERSTELNHDFKQPQKHHTTSKLGGLTIGALRDNATTELEINSLEKNSEQKQSEASLFNPATGHHSMNRIFTNPPKDHEPLQNQQISINEKSQIVSELSKKDKNEDKPVERVAIGSQIGSNPNSQSQSQTRLPAGKQGAGHTMEVNVDVKEGIDPNTVISMLDRIRVQYEQMFLVFKQQRETQIIFEQGVPQANDSRKNVLLQYGDTISTASGIQTKGRTIDFTNTDSHMSGIASPKTMGSNLGAFMMQNEQNESNAIPLRTLQIRSGSNQNSARPGSVKVGHQLNSGRPLTGSGSARRSINTHKRNNTVSRTLQPMGSQTTQNQSRHHIYKKFGLNSINPGLMAHDHVQGYNGHFPNHNLHASGDFAVTGIGKSPIIAQQSAAVSSSGNSTSIRASLLVNKPTLRHPQPTKTNDIENHLLTSSARDTQADI